MPRPRAQEGFTLIELLVVIAIIGILATIALPAFLGHTRGASDARAKSDAANAERAITTHWTDHDTYAVTPAQLIALEPALSNAINLSVTGTATTFVLRTESKQGHVFAIERTAAGLQRTCAPAGEGGCSVNATW